MLTISDNVFTGEELSVMERQESFNEMMEIALETALKSPKEIVKQEIIYKERPPRKITEIRIFFDDNTYETFKPEN